MYSIKRDGNFETLTTFPYWICQNYVFLLLLIVSCLFKFAEAYTTQTEINRYLYATALRTYFASKIFSMKTLHWVLETKTRIKLLSTQKSFNEAFSQVFRNLSSVRSSLHHLSWKNIDLTRHIGKLSLLSWNEFIDMSLAVWLHNLNGMCS